MDRVAKLHTTLVRQRVSPRFEAFRMPSIGRIRCRVILGLHRLRGGAWNVLACAIERFARKRPNACAGHAAHCTRCARPDTRCAGCSLAHIAPLPSPTTIQQSNSSNNGGRRPPADVLLAVGARGADRDVQKLGDGGVVLRAPRDGLGARRRRCASSCVVCCWLSISLLCSSAVPCL